MGFTVNFQQWILCVLLFYSLPKETIALSPDGQALVNFRTSIISSDGVLLQWRPEDLDPCGWKGVKCDFKSKRVTALTETDSPDDKSSTRSMGSNGTSHFRGIADDEETRCKCGFRMVTKICKKEPNRGRRFIMCPIRGDDSCHFFTWCDPEPYTDSMEVVGMLLRRIDDYERDIQTCKQRVEWVTKVAIVGYVATLLCIVVMLSGM